LVCDAKAVVGADLGANLGKRGKTAFGDDRDAGADGMGLTLGDGNIMRLA